MSESWPARLLDSSGKQNTLARTLLRVNVRKAQVPRGTLLTHHLDSSL